MRPRLDRAVSIGLLVLLGMIWGANFPFTKLALTRISGVDAACLRTFFGAVPVLGFAFARGQLSTSHFRSIHHFAAMGLLANVGPHLFFVLGTARLPSGIAGTISGAIPCIAAAVIAVALPEERLTYRKIAGLALGFGGVLLVTPSGGSFGGAGSSAVLGAIYMLIGSVSYALALVYARRFVQPLGHSPVTLAAYQMALGFLLLLPFARLESFWVLAADKAALLALVVGVGVVGTGIAFVIYYMLIARLGALRAGSVYYIPPAVALMLGALMLDEPFGLKEMAGAGLICVGIYFANSRTQGAAARPPDEDGSDPLEDSAADPALAA